MYRMSLESWCHCHWSWDCQAFSDYQMQQMTSNFIDQFGFNDEKFADQDDIGKWVYSPVSLVTQAFCEVLPISRLLGFCKSLSWEVHPVYLQPPTLYLGNSSTAKVHTLQGTLQGWGQVIFVFEMSLTVLPLAGVEAVNSSVFLSQLSKRLV